MNDQQADQFWKFVRGDLSTDGFEAWLYSQTDLEAAVGEALYFTLISTNYRSIEEIYSVKKTLEALLRPLMTCECAALPNSAVVPMGMQGLDGRFFATVDTVAEYGPEVWWLYASRCRACGQGWLVAQEERIYDDLFLKRLTVEEIENVVGGNWPEEFRTYESVLIAGRQLSRSCRFIDPLAHSLTDTARILKRDRSDMPDAELASLLGVDIDHARAILKASSRHTSR
ncbi:hypothetical protein [Asticcacaulis sp. YBE204]|uniref:hypothetical protein n=1 Tax=Asticcacaulis sp. YBE204 TaxID=1282363 RepID=UPI0003C3C275|nr:hypothetical protein [Asticcacaulis sp. YBE204]ESQ78258.1 hypothetical protein AEYBE204_15600 [Asticcacaulis sp. YBE204]